ncbi:uncharacterized protein LOC134538053 [Bacillus rossius redtenbacheri]|uniref:uncharacterized protein LOC134538053 n=1 Tax=Bacillus rossius redtenbacheri TaxID=93214 RepID=UPI002FDECFCD
MDYFAGFQYRVGQMYVGLYMGLFMARLVQWYPVPVMAALSGALVVWVALVWLVLDEPSYPLLQLSHFLLRFPMTVVFLVVGIVAGSFCDESGRCLYRADPPAPP